MTKARIRAILHAVKLNSAHTAIIHELVAEVESFQARTRRGESLSDPKSEELPLAANVNPKKKARGSQSEMEAFAIEIELPASDGEYFFHKMQSTDWKVGGKPIKDWKATIRAWKAGGYLPSQKQQPRNGSSHHPQQGPAQCRL